MAAFHGFTITQLKEAFLIRERIEELQQKLDALLGGTTPKANPGDPAAEPTKAGAGRSKIGAAPKWRWAHVRSPLDTLMDAALEKTGGSMTERRTKQPGPGKKSAPRTN